MKLYGWNINLSGNSIPVYEPGMSPDKQIGTITKNECFCEGSSPDSGFEGWDYGQMVLFLNASHEMTAGMIDARRISGLESFADYASNGTSWVKVSTLERKLVNPTKSYYADGSDFKYLPAGSTVWLTSGCAHGTKNWNYIAVTSVQPAGDRVYNFSGNGFINLTDFKDESTEKNIGSMLEVLY